MHFSLPKAAWLHDPRVYDRIAPLFSLQQLQHTTEQKGIKHHSANQCGVVHHRPSAGYQGSLSSEVQQHALNQYQYSQHVQLQHRELQARHGYASHLTCPAGFAYARIKEEAKAVRANVPATSQTTQKLPANSENVKREADNTGRGVTAEAKPPTKQRKKAPRLRAIMVKAEWVRLLTFTRWLTHTCSRALAPP